jgi:16S rRNA (uracil1498-N3)-methyltransferase
MTKTTPRLYVPLKLAHGATFQLEESGAHYVRNVLRMAAGDALRVFNERDGEWLCHVTEAGKKRVEVRCERALAEVRPPPDLDYLFAPLKHARLDYMVQKATELGVRRLIPVLTRRTVAERVNLDRMRANAIEAAEQCNLVFLPEVLEPRPLEHVLRDWEPGRSLVYCDETFVGVGPLSALSKLTTPAALLVGPEGGFTPEEKQMLTRQSFVTPISLGPRIMRADTAAVAALALVQAAAGDWGKTG